MIDPATRVVHEVYIERF